MSEFDLEERTRTKIEAIANDYKMQWDNPANDGKYLLLVEHINDRKCYFKLFNPNKVEIKTTMGCNNMYRVFIAIQPLGIPNFAIKDSDFARVCGCIPTEPNYFITDYHDHEMMCLSNREILREVFSNLAITYDEPLVDETFADLTMLTKIKWYNYYHHLNINFKGYKPRGKAKEELISFDSIYCEVMRQSPKCTVSITEADVLDFVNSQIPQDRFEITNGHDFLDILSQSIEHKYNVSNLNREILLTIIYACFNPARFARTELYHSIRAWACDKADELLTA